jgi:hypothetical protein
MSKWGVEAELKSWLRPLSLETPLKDENYPIVVTGLV